MKIAIVGPGFTGAVFPLANYMCNKGHDVDCFFFTPSGLTSIESLDFDEPLSWRKFMLQIPTSNHLYNYLSKSVGVFVIPVLKRHLKLEKMLIGLPNKWFNRIRVNRFINKLFQKQYERIILIDQTDNDHQVGLALKKHGVKFITTFHEVLYNQKRDRIRDSVINSLKLEVPVVVHCDDIRQLLINLSGIENLSKRVSLMRVGPFEAMWQYGAGRIVDSVEPGYFLFSGRIIEYKGVKYLYEATEELSKKYNIHIVVAGSGGDPILEKMKHDSKYTVINRYIDNEELAWLTRNCKAIVCPYIAASQSGLMPQAFAYKKPVIATRVGAFPEVIKEGELGYLAEPGNSHDFARAMEKCVLGERALIFDNLPQSIDWDYISDQYINLLSTL